MPAPDDATEYLLSARRMVEEARKRFDLLASTVLPENADAVNAAKGFRDAIGEISPEQAFEGLVAWMNANGIQALPGHGCVDPVVDDGKGCSE